MRINREECNGLVIDIQEKLFPHMDQKEELLRKTLILTEGMKILGIPVMVTEQYPKGLGPTLGSIHQAMESSVPVEKISFSCCDEPAYFDALEQSGRDKVIIWGIEAHVCVMQTVIDLAGSGYKPVVVADCISSRNPLDKQWAIERMRTEGAIITTCESILFELTRVAGSDEFRAISRLVK
ncbi:MAG: hydrolase [Bacteroidota bacterium]